MPFFSQVVILLYVLKYRILDVLLVQIRCTFFVGAKLHRNCTGNFGHF